MRRKKNSPSRYSRKKENMASGRGGIRKITTIVNKKIIHQPLKASPPKRVDFPSRNYCNEVETNSKPYEMMSIPQAKSGDGELTDSILDELDGLEKNFFEKKCDSNEIVPPTISTIPLTQQSKRPSVDSILSFFGATKFELALSKFRSSVFQVEVRKDYQSKPVGFCYEARSLCYPESFQNEPWNQNIGFTRYRITRSKCSCSVGRCVHCCATLVCLWIDIEDDKTEKLFKLRKELSNLKGKYSSLLEKYQAMTPSPTVLKEECQHIIPPPPPTPQVEASIGMENTQKNGSGLIIEEEEEEEGSGISKELFKKKKVTWKNPLTETMLEVQKKKIPKPQVSNPNSLLKKSLSVLINFNEGKAIVPEDSHSQHVSSSSSKNKKKRKRNSELYSGIPEKTDNLKKRKIE